MITKEMTVLEIVEKHPEAEYIFRTYNDIIDNCVLCSCLFDTIDSLTIDYDINLEVLLYKISRRYSFRDNEFWIYWRKIFL